MSDKQKLQAAGTQAVHHAALRHQAEVRSIVRWLVEQGFPYNWHSTVPAPAFLKPLLAAEWAKQEGEQDAAPYLETLDLEQVWRA